MTFPRSSASAAANSSLGAVGGARGTAAGAIRVILEFLTQYDGAAVKQLEKDLNSVESSALDASNKQVAAQNGLARATKQRTAAEKELRKIIAQSDNPTALRREIKQIQDIGVLSKAGKQRLSDLSQEVTGNTHLATVVSRITNEKKQQARFTSQAANAQKSLTIATEQQGIIQGQLSKFQQVKDNVLPKLGGLLTGAASGIFGGALIGVGFAAANAVLDQIEQSLDDLFDPARHARDAIKDLGAAINTLADSEANAGDTSKAAVEFLKSIGLAADDATVKLLAQYAVDVKVLDITEKQKEVKQAAAHTDAIATQARQATIQSLIDEDNAQGKLHIRVLQGVKGTKSGIDMAYYAAKANKQLTKDTNAVADASRAAADAALIEAAAQKQQAASAQLAAFAQENLVNTLEKAANTRLAQFDAQSSAISAAGPSSRTLSLQKRIESLQSGGGGNQTAQQIQNIDEQRGILLLRQKLRLLGTNINLEKYEGKFLLEAIDAKEKALQKQADAQDRLNQLLDLQYQMSQTLRRNQGESIQDFVERRAQTERGYLVQQQKLEDAATEARLDDLKDKTETEVQLRDLAEQKKNVLAQGGADHRLKILEKELKASQKADAAATKSKLAAVAAAKKAYADQAATAEEYATATKNTEIRIAIEGAHTLGQLAEMSGQIQGLAAAQAFLLALKQSGALSGNELAQVNAALTRIADTFATYDRRVDKLAPTSTVGGRHRLKAGGLINLNNASTGFGRNAQFGEEGTELGLVLQHKVAASLKDSMGKGVGQVGPFYLQKGDDWQRDRYEMRRLVKEAVTEAMG